MIVFLIHQYMGGSETLVFFVLRTVYSSIKDPDYEVDGFFWVFFFQSSQLIFKDGATVSLPDLINGLYIHLKKKMCFLLLF